MEKQNDWLAAIFFQPDMSIQDLADLGITPDNSELKTREYYKNIPEIQEAFKDDNGKLDEKKFNGFYNSIESVYNTASDVELNGNILNQYSYDPRDRFAPRNAKLRDVSAKIIEYPNPYGQSRGLSASSQFGDPTLSIRESAQKNLVFDPEKNTFEDYTPNDLNLFSFWERPTLVLAQYDEDGIHEVNGKQVVHKKGEYKFDDQGNPFYEKLGSRSSVNKEVLHVSDILTTDGSVWNKYDFFDSDGLTKSAFGTVAKTVASVVPYFIPYANINVIWGAAEAARQLSTALPELYKSIIGLAGFDVDKNSKTANRIAGFARRLDASLSDEGKKRFFSLENIGNIAVDSIGQLMQQRAVWKGVNKLLNPKTAEEIEYAKKMSLSYMAATSTAQSFEEFRNAGASDRVAGLGALASSLAIWKLMSIDYFRDFALGDELERGKLLPGIKNAAQEAVDIFGEGIEAPSKKKAVEWVTKTANMLFSNALAAGALNEGVEEVAEEVTMDLVKGLSSALNYIGILDKDRSYNFGFSASDMLSRYGVSFVGGAIGGALFSGYNQYEAFIQNKKMPEEITPNNLSELVFYFRNGYGDKIKHLTTKLYKNKKLANANLSFQYRVDDSGDSKKLIFETSKDGNSQNDVIYNYLMNQYKYIEDLMKKENLMLTDEALNGLVTANPDLFENMSDSDKKEHAEFMLIQYRQNMMESGMVTRILNDFQDIATEIIQTESTMQSMLTPKENESKTPGALDNHIAAVKKNAEYKKLEAKLKELRTQRDDILEGRKSQYYFEQGLFLGTPHLVGSFVHDFGLKRYSQIHFGKKYNELDEVEKKIVNENYEEYLKNEGKDIAYTSFEIFKHLSDILSGDIKSEASRISKFKTSLYGTQSQFLAALTQKQKELQELTEKVQEAQANGDADTLLNLAAIQSNIEGEIKQLQSNPLYHFALTTNDTLPVSGDLETDINTLTNYLQVISDQSGYIDVFDTNLSNLVKSISAHIDAVEGQTPAVKKAVIESLKQGDIKAFSENVAVLIGELDDDRADIFESLKPAVEMLSGLKQSPAAVLLQKTLNALDGNTGAYSNLQSLLESILTLDDVDHFQIHDDVTINNLEELSALISIVAGIVESSKPGEFNSVVNSVHKADKIVLENNESVEILSGFRLLSDRINLMLKINENNRMSQKQMQKRIYYNMRERMLKSILDTDIKEKINSEFEIDLQQLYDSCGFPEVTNESTFKEYERAAIEFETKLRDLLYEKHKTNRNILEKVYKVFGSKMFVGSLTTFDDKQDNIVGDVDKSLYFLHILAFPSAEYAKAYKKFVENNSKIAPLYPQEYAVKLAYAFAKNSQFLKDLGELMNSKNEDFVNSLSGLDADDISYLKSKKFLKNFVPAILGGAGVGKTQAMLYTLFTLLGDVDNAEFLVCGPKQTQVDNLTKALSVDSTRGLDKDSFIQAILGRSLTSEDWSFENNKIVLNPEVIREMGEKQTMLFSQNASGFMIIDEIGTYNSAELQLISEWASLSNTTIIPAGDLKQLKPALSKKVGDGIKKAFSGIEDFLYLSAPEVVASIRPKYVAKYKNYISLSTSLRRVQNLLKQRPHATEPECNNLVKEVSTLFWGETENGELVGERIVGRDTAIQEVEKMLSYSQDTIIIVDDPNTSIYKQYKSDTVKVLTPEQAQGLECEYVILATDFSKNRAGEIQGEYGQMTDIYTSSQRSTKGTLIINNGTLLPSIKSEKDNRGANEISFDESIIADFKQWRLDLLSLVDNVSNAIQPLVTEEPQTGETSGEDSGNDTSYTEDAGQSTPSEGSNENHITPSTTPSVVSNPTPGTSSTVNTNGLNSARPTITSTGKTWRADYKKSMDFLLNGMKSEVLSSNSWAKGLVQNAARDREMFQIFNKLAWFIKAGYYLTDEDKASTLSAEVLKFAGVRGKLNGVVDAIVNKEFTVHVSAGSDLVKAQVPLGDKVATIPLFKIQHESAIDVEYSAKDIAFERDTNNLHYKKQVVVHTPVNDVSDFFVMSKSNILTVKTHGDGAISQDHSQYEFVRKNSGSIMQIWSVNPFDTSTALNDCFNPGIFGSDTTVCASYEREDGSDRVLLAIEHEISLQQFYDGSTSDGYNVNNTTASYMLSRFLTYDPFKRMFRKYLEDNFVDSKLVINSSTNGTSNIPVNQAGQIAIDNVVATIQRAVQSMGNNNSVEVYLEKGEGDSKKRFSASTILRFMNLRYKVPIVDLERALNGFTIHSHTKMSNTHTLHIWSGVSNTSGTETVNVEFQNHPGFIMHVDEGVPVVQTEETQETTDAAEVTKNSLEESLKQRLSAQTISGELFEDSWNSGIFYVNSQSINGYVYYDGNNIINVPQLVLDNELTKKYIQDVCAGSLWSETQIEELINNLYATSDAADDIVTTLTSFEDAIKNKCV